MLDIEMFISTPIIETSKTDQVRKGNEVVTAECLSKDSCPVTILSRYTSDVERFPVEADHYVFRTWS